MAGKQKTDFKDERSFDVTMKEIQDMAEAEIEKVRRIVASRQGWVTQRKKVVDSFITKGKQIEQHNIEVINKTKNEPMIDEGLAKETMRKLKEAMQDLEDSNKKFELAGKRFIEILQGTELYDDVDPKIDVQSSVDKTENTIKFHIESWFEAEEEAAKLIYTFGLQYRPDTQWVVPGQNQQTCKPNLALKPAHTLSLDSSWDQRTEWLTEFNNYFETSNMGGQSAAIQRHYLKGCIEEDLWIRIKALDLHPDDPVVPASKDTGIFKIINEILDKKNPLLSKRAEVFNLAFNKNAGGEYEEFSGWESRLYNVFRAGKMGSMSTDDWLLTICYAHAHDQLKAKMIKEKDLTWTRMREIGRDLDIFLRDSKSEGITVSQVSQGSINHVGKKGTSTCLLCKEPLSPISRNRNHIMCTSCFKDTMDSQDAKSSTRIGKFKCDRCRSEGNHLTKACTGKLINIRWKGKRNASGGRGPRDNRGSRNNSKSSREGSRSRTSSHNRDRSSSGDRFSRRGRKRDKSPYSRSSYTPTSLNMISNAYEHHDSGSSTDEINLISNKNHADLVGEAYTVDDVKEEESHFHNPNPKKDKLRRIKLIKAFARIKHDHFKARSVGTSWTKAWKWIMSLLCVGHQRGQQQSDLPEDEVDSQVDGRILDEVNTIDCIKLTNLNLLKENETNKWIRRTPDLYNMKTILGNELLETEQKRGRKRVNASACADTGAFRSLCGPDVARKLDTEVMKTENVSISAANGQEMDYMGSTNLRVLSPNGQTITSTFLVSNTLLGRVIIGRGDLIALRLISKNFPNTALCEGCWNGNNSKNSD